MTIARSVARVASPVARPVVGGIDGGGGGSPTPTYDILVESLADIEDIMDGTTTVSANDVIAVAPGTYDTDGINMVNQPLNVTWKALNPANRPTFTRWSLNGLTNSGSLEFDGINWNMPYPTWIPNSAFWSVEPATVHGIINGSSANISSLTVKNFIANGNLAAWWDGGRLTHGNTFLYPRGIANVTVRDGEIRNNFNALTFDGVNGFTIENILFSGQHADPIVLQNQSNHCQDGVIKNCHMELPAGDTSTFHWDGIQFQPTAGSYFIRRIEIVGNTASNYQPTVVGQTDPSKTITYNAYSTSFAVASSEHGMETRLTPSGNMTVTIPTATTRGEQYCFRYVSGTGTVTFALNGADTYNGGSPPTLSAAGTALTFVSDGAGNWDTLSPGFRPWFLLRDYSFTLGSLEEGLVTKLNAGSGAVTATLPADGSETFHLQCEDDTNTCKVVAAAGDTITIHGSPVSEVEFVKGYGLTLVGDGAGNWAATEEPPTGTFLFGNVGDYEDITIHGNIAFVYGDAVVLQTPVANQHIYNNTFLRPVYADQNGDGVVDIYEGGISQKNRIEISASTAYSERNITSGAVSIGTYGDAGVKTGTIELEIADLDPLPASLTSHFAGSAQSDFLPQTRAEVIAAAAAQSGGPLDGTLIGARPYYDYSTGQVSSFTPPTLSIASSVPADDATGVAPSSAIEIIFNQIIEAGTGNITLRANNSGWSAVETFNIATGVGDNSGTVAIAGNKLTITPGADMADGVEHAIRIDATAIDGLTYGNSFVGISDDTTLSFTIAPAGLGYEDAITDSSLTSNAYRYIASVDGAMATVTRDGYDWFTQGGTVDEQHIDTGTSDDMPSGVKSALLAAGTFVTMVDIRVASVSSSDTCQLTSRTLGGTATHFANNNFFDVSLGAWTGSIHVWTHRGHADVSALYGLSAGTVYRIWGVWTQNGTDTRMYSVANDSLSDVDFRRFAIFNRSVFDADNATMDAEIAAMTP